MRLFHKDNKTELFTPGFICVLHTFGRDLKWNPHIHCLISEGGVGTHLIWKGKKHFSFEFLRRVFQAALLNELHSHLGHSFKKVKSSIYSNHENDFYVYAKPNECDPKQVIKYIGRYLSRPAIATSRIDSYDGEYVTFHYNRHEDDKLVVEKIPALEFIGGLIRHIPEKHFKMTHYYGVYARHRKTDESLSRAHKFYISLNTWRTGILSAFGYDPLKCSCCGATMEFLELYYNHHLVSLDELYKKVMAKSPACRSPAHT